MPPVLALLRLRSTPEKPTAGAPPPSPPPGEPGLLALRLGPFGLLGFLGSFSLLIMPPTLAFTRMAPADSEGRGASAAVMVR